MDRLRPPNKTYSHLQHLKTMPSEYELLSSQLLYHTARGFEVNVPLAGWYELHQKGSPLLADDWERFADPRETTYARYVALQTRKEIFVDGLLESIEAGDYDARLLPEWLGVLERSFVVLRYPFHGFQMLTAYQGQMAPSGRITIAALFQAADEMRRIQRVAYRMAQLQKSKPEFGSQSRLAWQEQAHWQPLRRTIEQLLVTWDWAESWVGLDLCLKPLIDELFMVHFADAARGAGDYLLGEILGSLAEDCRWHRAWARALAQVAVAAHPGNRAVLQSWIASWAPRAMEAACACAATFARDGDAARRIAEQLGIFHSEYLAEMGLEVSANRQSGDRP